MELDDRKKRILQAIVNEYIDTIEPVSSSSLIQKYGLDCSSATVRNEMAELEKIGYLEKTHTSSGRVPSNKGYRFYVDKLLNDKDLNIDEIKYINSRLQNKVDQMEELTKIATMIQFLRWLIIQQLQLAQVQIGKKLKKLNLFYLARVCLWQLFLQIQVQ